MDAVLTSKIAAVFKDLGAVSKTGVNQQQGFTYRSMEETTNALHPLMARHGVFIVPFEVRYERETRTTARGTLQTFTIVTVKYRIYCSESDDSIEMESIGEAADSGDKSVGKAMTYAYKVLLQLLFTLCSSEREDPDAYSPEESEDVINSKEYHDILLDIASANTTDRLKEIWKENPKYYKIQAFRDAMTNRKNELGEQPTKHTR